MSDLPTYVPLGTLAEKLSLAEITVRNWIREGKIPNHTYIKVGNTYRFNFEALERELLAKTQEEAFEDKFELPVPEIVKPKPTPAVDVELKKTDNVPDELFQELIEDEAEEPRKPFMLDDSDDLLGDY